MDTMTNKELVEKFAIIAGQQALAINYHEPRKEKRYENELLKLEEEILKRMER
jgi:hypothetical protein